MFPGQGLLPESLLLAQKSPILQKAQVKGKMLHLLLNLSPESSHQQMVGNYPKQMLPRKGQRL